MTEHFNRTIWKAPWGAYYRGPAGAFRIMLELKAKTNTDNRTKQTG